MFVPVRVQPTFLLIVYKPNGYEPLPGRLCFIRRPDHLCKDEFLGRGLRVGSTVGTNRSRSQARCVIASELRAAGLAACR